MVEFGHEDISAKFRFGRCRLIVIPFALFLSSCTIFPAAGPKTNAISDLPSQPTDTSLAPVQLVDVSAGLTRHFHEVEKDDSFATKLGDAVPYGSMIGRGDLLSIVIWESPPAVLFGGAAALGAGETIVGSNSSNLPEQVVNQDGVVTVPFAGVIKAEGRTPEALALEIQRKLAGKAHDPQVIVRIVQNSTADVTIVGDVAASVRMPLTPKGERLLDALASAGGVRQAIDKMTVQVTRGSTVATMALTDVIRDPRENIRLAANDVVTALYQPYSFTVLGAASRNEEVPFEGTGLSLSQALGRMGGLQDNRANARGVFIFRFEDPAIFAAGEQSSPAVTPEGKVPVIYRVDMKNPATLFAAQSFPIRDKDVIYVTNAPLADFQKFLQAVSQVIYPIVAIQNAATNF